MATFFMPEYFFAVILTFVSFQNPRFEYGQLEHLFDSRKKIKKVCCHPICSRALPIFHILIASDASSGVIVPSSEVASVSVSFGRRSR